MEVANVGKHVPPDERYREPADLRTGSDQFRPIGKDTYVNMPKSHIYIYKYDLGHILSLSCWLLIFLYRAVVQSVRERER